MCLAESATLNVPRAPERVHFVVFSVKIAQVRIYNTALTAANVLNNYNVTKDNY